MHRSCFRNIATKLSFSFKEIVTVCANLEFRVFRVGYFETPQIIAMCKDRKGILSLCFSGLLHCLKVSLPKMKYGL